MNRLIGALMFVLVVTQSGIAQSATSTIPTFEIKKPTIVAFFPPFKDADLDADPDLNEVLSDFQFYAGAAKGPLQRSGVVFQDATARSFRILIGSKARLIQTGKSGVGYYFIAPGQKAHIQYGVMTDADILETAGKYFGIPISK